jgi:hypothetical protein
MDSRRVGNQVLHGNFRESDYGGEGSPSFPLRFYRHPESREWAGWFLIGCLILSVAAVNGAIYFFGGWLFA